jgi:GTP-binding protein
MIDASENDLLLSYKQIRNELKKYSKDLLKKEEIVVFNKIDLIENNELKEKIKLFEGKMKKKVNILSNTDKKLISKLKSSLLGYVFK